jgi:hypothetical protein
LRLWRPSRRVTAGVAGLAVARCLLRVYFVIFVIFVVKAFLCVLCVLRG